MKKILSLAFLLCLAMMGIAQNYSTFIHDGSYPLHQCYNIVELSDGNFAVREAVFDANQSDIGYNIFKITPQGELLDSVFFENSNIDGLCPMFRNAPNSNIMVSFYNEDGRNYYKAQYFNDNLEITQEVIADYPLNMNFPVNFFVDSNSDIIARVRTGSKSNIFIKMGLDGEIKNMSDTLTYTGNVLFPQNTICEIGGDTARYVCATCSSDSKFTFYVFDSDINCIKTKTNLIIRVGEWRVYPSLTENLCGLSDGGFIMSSHARYSTNPSNISQILIKFNSEFEVEASYLWGGYISGQYQYPETTCMNKNLAVSDDHIFMVWQNKKKRGDRLSRQLLVVSCLDRDFNHIWDAYTNLEIIDLALFCGFGLTTTDNGGVAMSGWLATDNSSYYFSKTIYAMIFENHLSAGELADTCTPFHCYPNPAYDAVNISFSEGVQPQLVEVYSLDGRKMAEQNFNFSKVSLSSLNAGVYLMKITLTDGRTFTERVVVGN